MQPAIRVENLSKRYRINHAVERGGYRTLRESLARSAGGLVRRFRNNGDSGQAEDFWALRDVSFEVQPGEVVGIIGRNGAGKSTLLKILSRITKPTTGHVALHGRVGSLLEVGTGFHPELTGRENIYLNGAILGMSRSDITRQFDAIVDFSGTEQFLDTPVKRYSSGMYVRLAFAVAAHLEPEILIIDEVLSVGDATFQKKCLGALGQIARQGRTVLFVSHQMNAVRSLCRMAVLLEYGGVRSISSDVDVVIADYLSYDGNPGSAHEWNAHDNMVANVYFAPRRFFLGDGNGNPVKGLMANGKPLYVYIEGQVKTPDIALQLGYALYDSADNLLYWSVTTDSIDNRWPTLTAGRHSVRSRLPARVLNEGSYRAELLVSLYHREWICRPGHNSPAISLTISGGLSDSRYWMERRPGILAPLLEWEHTYDMCS